MASNEEKDTTRHFTNDSLTTKHISEKLLRTLTTHHIENRLGTTETPTQNQGSAPANSNGTGGSSGQGSSGSTE